MLLHEGPGVARASSPRGLGPTSWAGPLESGRRVCPSTLGAAQPTPGQCPPHSCPVAQELRGQRALAAALSVRVEEGTLGTKQVLVSWSFEVSVLLLPPQVPPGLGLSLGPSHSGRPTGVHALLLTRLLDWAPWPGPPAACRVAGPFPHPPRPLPACRCHSPGSLHPRPLSRARGHCWKTNA